MNNDEIISNSACAEKGEMDMDEQERCLQVSFHEDLTCRQIFKCFDSEDSASKGKEQVGVRNVISVGEWVIP